jgi:acetyl esterase/lipase
MKPLLAAALLVFASAAAARAASDVGIDVRQNITYYDGEGADKYRNRLDLYLPSGPRDVPAVIFVHGGGWTTGIKDQYTQIGRFFAAHGVAAAVINYRLSPTVAFPGQVEDVARAFAWVKAHIHEYGGRADAIFLCGHSAGAHLIALVATDPTYLRTVGASLADVKGVIPISGVYTASPRLGLFAAGPPPDAATLQRASPIAHAAAGRPPFLILYGDGDAPRTREDGEAMTRALVAAGSTARSQEIGNRNHMQMVLDLVQDGDPGARLVLDFISKASSR